MKCVDVVTRLRETYTTVGADNITDGLTSDIADAAKYRLVEPLRSVLNSTGGN